MIDSLPIVEVNPSAPHEATVIWLHGLGADGHDFEPIAPHLQSLLPIPVRFVFPHAPRRPVTVNGGYIMRAWYDIAGANLTREEDSSGIHESANQINILIQREIHGGIDARRIVLAGFSQGGAMVLHTGVRYPQRLAGILALSSYLPLADKVATEAHPINRDIPVFMGHGDADPIVPLSFALKSKRVLQELGYQVEWHTYGMPHSLCDEEVADIATWLSRALDN